MQGSIVRMSDSHWQTCGDSWGQRAAVVIDAGEVEQFTVTHLNTVLGLFLVSVNYRNGPDLFECVNKSIPITSYNNLAISRDAVYAQA